ncbi:NAD-dependent epimerase/dehydratase family protein [Oceanithermus sp.]
MDYLVTGATGFIGGRLARQLLAQGHRVRVLARNPARARALEAAGARIFAGEIGDAARVRTAMDGADGVFHVAGWYAIGSGFAREGERTNVEGTRVVLEAALERKVPKVVYTSTIAVYGDTRGRLVDETYFYDGRKRGWASAYDRSKWIAHYEVARSLVDRGLPLVIVLPGLVYGPGDHSPIGGLLRDVVRNRPLLLPAATRYCWSHVDDAALAHRLAMERGRVGEEYITAGEPARLLDALHLARRLAGSRSPIVPLPNALLKALSYPARPFDRWLPPSYTSEGLRVAATSYTAANAKARSELGYAPRPLEAGLPPTLAALRDEIGRASR